MTRRKWRRRLADLRPKWAESDRQFREVVARRQQRRPSTSPRRRARLRLLTFGLLDR